MPLVNMRFEWLAGWRVTSSTAIRCDLELYCFNQKKASRDGRTQWCHEESG